ncbi:LytTR family DNA-binding domain-containing protein [Ruminococcus sp. MSJ-25]|uniref:LytR/AlgR family response regulator transcription factor n=1 Tax=Ruminococcus sp. MSJ-25 TaxID=2841536 RepID=UPI001C0F910E|nr:LytTR family DNA-binding domain-containing protein [Ruminococcus sp. MSJ-25]MBU5407881.1 LytTR family DNA-binding domain-containing protein [Ruminococcus sp. MSJ-25]
MRVALVDDNKNDLALLHEYISEQTAHSCQIDTFSSGESFLSCWQMGAYDLVVLDIFMGKMTGIEVAEKLRETDKSVHIAFGTSSNEFASESYDLNACYYLCKPFQADKVKAMLDRIGSDEIDRMRSVKLPDGQNVILRNVIYIDCASHIVTIHCADGESIVSRNSFAEIESIFCSHSYFYTSTKGVIVNFYEITQQKSDLFIMSDGTHIPISRRKSRETLDAFAQFRFSDLRKGGEQ